jgi:hypothetical protein
LIYGHAAWRSANTLRPGTGNQSGVAGFAFESSDIDIDV